MSVDQHKKTTTKIRTAEEKATKKHLDELVEETSEDSFPASDPPSWNMGTTEEDDGKDTDKK